MSQQISSSQRLSAALRKAALQAADVALQQGQGLFRAAWARSGRLQRAAEQVNGRLRHAGERLIAKSPIPMPSLAEDALGRMQEALHQLEHVIESGDVSALKANRDQNKMHQQGRVDVKASEPAAPAIAKAKEPRARVRN